MQARDAVSGGEHAAQVAGAWLDGLSELELVISVGVFSALLVVIFLTWRFRRLRLRAGHSGIEVLPGAEDSHADGST